jgi:hypothetical protein
MIKCNSIGGFKTIWWLSIFIFIKYFKIIIQRWNSPHYLCKYSWALLFRTLLIRNPFLFERSVRSRFIRSIFNSKKPFGSGTCLLRIPDDFFNFCFCFTLRFTSRIRTDFAKCHTFIKKPTNIRTSCTCKHTPNWCVILLD